MRLQTWCFCWIALQHFVPIDTKAASYTHYAQQCKQNQKSYLHFGIAKNKLEKYSSIVLVCECVCSERHKWPIEPTMCAHYHRQRHRHRHCRHCLCKMCAFCIQITSTVRLIHIMEPYCTMASIQNDTVTARYSFAFKFILSLCAGWYLAFRLFFHRAFGLHRQMWLWYV